MANKILFFSEDTTFKPKAVLSLKKWIKNSLIAEGINSAAINYIFCSDPYLLEINQEYLNHDYFTDIITFDNSEDEGLLEGDIYISIDRIRENAQNLNLSFTDELHRVMIHGVLHLCGYSDKGKAEKQIMRLKEDTYLSLREN